VPTYDYRCNACGKSFEIFHSMTQAAKRKCPACGKLKLERMIGAGSGVIFKGSGFYETDYRSESYNKAKAADKPESSTSKKDDSKASSKAKDAPKKSKSDD